MSLVPAATAPPAPAPSAPATDVRLLRGLFLGSFAVLGATVPFLAGALKAESVSGWSFVFVMAALPLGRMLVGPWAGKLADTRGLTRAALRLGAGLSLLGAMGMLFHVGVPTLLASVVLFSIGLAPVGPLVDSLALAFLQDSPGGYGALRGWGSAGYLLASFGVGWWVDLSGGSPFWATAASLAVVLACALALPAPQARPTAGASHPSFSIDAALALILVAGGLHFAVHVACSALLDVHLRSIDLPSRWTGTAIAAGVVVEIVVLSRASVWLPRVGARRAFVAVMFLAAVRWTAMLFVRSPWAVVAVQSMHGLTFGVFWVSAVALVDDWAGPQRRARGQAALSGAVAGGGALLGVAGGSALVEATNTSTLFGLGTVVAIAAGIVAWMGVRR